MYIGRLCGVALLSMTGSAGAQVPRTPGDCDGLAAYSAEAAIRHCNGEVTDWGAPAFLGQDLLNQSPLPFEESYAGTGREAVDAVAPSSAPTVLDVFGEAPPLAPPAARDRPLVQIDGEDWATEQQRARSSVDAAVEPAAREGFWQAPPRLVPLTPTAEPHAEVDGQMVPMHEWLEGSFLDKPADLPQVELHDQDPSSTPQPPSEIMRSSVIDGVPVDLDPVSYQLLELIRRSSGAANSVEVPAVEADVLKELDEQSRADEEE